MVMGGGRRGLNPPKEACWGWNVLDTGGHWGGGTVSQGQRPRKQRREQQWRDPGSEGPSDTEHAGLSG
jgi:hypothetical protein